LLEGCLEVVLHGVLEHCWLLEGEGGVVYTWDTFGRTEMVQILGQCLKLSSCEILLVLFGLDGLYFAILLELPPELLVFLLQSFHFLFAHVEVMDEFAYEVASEDLLDERGLMVEVAETLGVEVLLAPQSVAFASVVGAEMCLDGDGCCLLPEEFFAFYVHFELRLNLQGGCVVTRPILLALVSAEVVDFLDGFAQGLDFLDQFH
jgi:hypothetical protein